MPHHDFDPAYRQIQREMKPAVKSYQQHTLVVKEFLRDHGLEAVGWEIWDVAPFHVLNVRKGRAVPMKILHALDAAIQGREVVTDQLTEANLNPQLLLDASDITHRVFIEKLRTLRRVWFPNVPDATMTAPASTTTSLLTSKLTVVHTSPTTREPATFGPFNALSGASAGSPFYKVSFDTPVELSVVSGGATRNFAITPGHVKLIQQSSTSATKSNSTRKTTKLKQTAAEVAAAVTTRLLGKKRKISTAKDDPPKQASKKRKLGEDDPEYIQISSDSESESDCDDTESVLSLEVEESALSRQTRSSKREGERGLAEDAATLPIRRSPRLRKQWIVDIGPTGDMTFYNPSGASPCTYVEEDTAKEKLRELLTSSKALVVTTKWNGQARELPRKAIKKLAKDREDSVLDILSGLMAAE